MKKSLKKKIDECRKEIKGLNSGDFELMLKIDKEDNSLEIGYLNKDKFLYLGFIDYSGECYILNNGVVRENYDVWVQNGMKIKKDCVVEWRGVKYLLDYYMLKRADMDFAKIYNFNECIAYSNCKDINIQRYENNLTPIMF